MLHHSAGPLAFLQGAAPLLQPQQQVDQLPTLGFTQGDFQEALCQVQRQFDGAVRLLTQLGNPVRSRALSVVATGQTSFFAGTSVRFTSVQLKTSCINLVVINNCRDLDYTLLKLSLSSLHLKQRQGDLGCLTSRLSASYYNRELSALEPCIEPWCFTLDWISTSQQQETEERCHHQVGRGGESQPDVRTCWSCS